VTYKALFTTVPLSLSESGSSLLFTNRRANVWFPNRCIEGKNDRPSQSPCAGYCSSARTLGSVRYLVVEQSISSFTRKLRKGGGEDGA
jgi:hypothetical protein